VLEFHLPTTSLTISPRRLITHPSSCPAVLAVYLTRAAAPATPSAAPCATPFTARVTVPPAAAALSLRPPPEPDTLPPPPCSARLFADGWLPGASAVAALALSPIPAGLPGRLGRLMAASTART
jgi:hypothetical protein